MSQTTQPGPLGRGQLLSRPLPCLLSHLPSEGGSVPSHVSYIDRLQQAPDRGASALQGNSCLSAPFIPDCTDLRGSSQETSCFWVIEGELFRFKWCSLREHEPVRGRGGLEVTMKKCVWIRDDRLHWKAMAHVSVIEWRSLSWDDAAGTSSPPCRVVWR